MPSLETLKKELNANQQLPSHSFLQAGLARPPGLTSLAADLLDSGDIQCFVVRGIPAHFIAD